MEPAGPGGPSQGAGRGIGPGLAGEGLAPDQKKPRRRGAEIAFVDETGFSFRDGVATTWAPRGRTPVLKRVSKRRVLSTAIGLTLSGRIHKRHFERAIRGPDAVRFLEHLRRQVGGPMIVIWDRLPAHRSKEVAAYVAGHRDLLIEWLPPYAPDLNPEEGCHGNVKQGMKNAIPESVEEIRHHANRGFARLRQRPDLILGFFHHAGYRVRQLT
jgi:transposase